MDSKTLKTTKFRSPHKLTLLIINLHTYLFLQKLIQLCKTIAYKDTIL